MVWVATGLNGNPTRFSKYLDKHLSDRLEIFTLHRPRLADKISFQASSSLNSS